MDNHDNCNNENDVKDENNVHKAIAAIAMFLKIKITKTNND